MSSAVKIDLIKEAKAFAAHCHRNQRWPYTGESYLVHLEAVAKRVMSVPKATPEMVAAAWLHDVVNDQEVHLGEIREAFGDQVADLVEELTDPAKLEDGDRDRHAEINRMHLAMASQGAQTIKLADLADNAQSMVEHNQKDSKVYMNESLQLLLAIKGDPELWQDAWTQVGHYFFKHYKG
ncbi:MAG: HD domain-containing protein [Holophaga sp.]|nr:HD domain-containing protein [Holophaga sp.]